MRPISGACSRATLHSERYDKKMALHHSTCALDCPDACGILVTVDDSGKSKQTLLAPNLKLAEIKNRAVIIHQGGDNYSDQPQPLGGGGRRIACGIIP